MNTQTGLVAEQIRDCRNRPSDMKVDAWCQQHGITKARIIITVYAGYRRPAWNFVVLPLPLWNLQHQKKVCLLNPSGNISL